MSKVLVTGAAGMLGTALISAYSRDYAVVATDLEIGSQFPGVRWVVADLSDQSLLRNLVLSEGPELVIHAAAIVDVDRCERDPALAEQLHVQATNTIGEALAQTGGAMIYISTDSVFNGQKPSPYRETDTPAPLNVYASTKLAGEHTSLTFPRSLVLRTNIIGWTRTNRLSFAEWTLRGLVEGSPLGMFADVQFTPIHVSLLANVILDAWRLGLTGLFHAAGSTSLSKYEFALQMASEFGLSAHNVVARSVDDASLAAKRPRNLALSNAKLIATLGRPLPPVGDSIILMKAQYDDGWVATIKGRATASHYRFWEEP
jgi:dTDP-4-dehydrorhamnose reductase